MLKVQIGSNSSLLWSPKSFRRSCLLLRFPLQCLPVADFSKCFEFLSFLEYETLNRTFIWSVISRKLRLFMYSEKSIYAVYWLEIWHYLYSQCSIITYPTGFLHLSIRFHYFLSPHLSHFSVLFFCCLHFLRCSHFFQLTVCLKPKIHQINIQCHDV